MGGSQRFVLVVPELPMFVVLGPTVALKCHTARVFPCLNVMFFGHQGCRSSPFSSAVNVRGMILVFSLVALKAWSAFLGSHWQLHTASLWLLLLTCSLCLLKEVGIGRLSRPVQAPSPMSVAGSPFWAPSLPSPLWQSSLPAPRLPLATAW